VEATGNLGLAQTVVADKLEFAGDRSFVVNMLA